MPSKRIVGTGVVWALAVACASGCASTGVVSAGHAAARPVALQGSLEEFMGKVRAQSERVHPMPGRAATIEATNPPLAAALRELSKHPSAAGHQAVAREYVKLGILDVAHEHFSAAVAIDPQDGASWDGLARIWRDWGFPHLALPDAYRALHYAPRSAVVHNTLGTILQALGRLSEARRYYERALVLDQGAAYSLTNLCYNWLASGEAGKAAEVCRRALALQPDFEPARNNLALAYAATGNFDLARDTFAGAGDSARATYNLGVLYLAHHKYAEALQAFRAAGAIRPSFRAADAMARYARRQLDAETLP